MTKRGPRTFWALAAICLTLLVLVSTRSSSTAYYRSVLNSSSLGAPGDAAQLSDDPLGPASTETQPPLASPSKDGAGSSVQTKPQSSLPLADSDFDLPRQFAILGKSSLWRNEPFFHENSRDSHRAAQYGADLDLDQDFERRGHLLQALMHSLAGFSDENGFVFWLAHATLLGQVWGGKIMAMDHDIDVQTTVASLTQMSRLEESLYQDRYALVINPHYVIRDSFNAIQKGSERNIIDARWIDTQTGVFVDITAVSRTTQSATHSSVQDKSIHTYQIEDLSPLVRCTFEEALLWCPRDTPKVLAEEYPQYLEPQHDGWRFNSSSKEWEPILCSELILRYSYKSPELCEDAACRAIVSHERRLSMLYIVVEGGGENRCDVTVHWEEQGSQRIKSFRGIQKGPDVWKTLGQTRFPAVSFP